MTLFSKFGRLKLTAGQGCRYYSSTRVLIIFTTRVFFNFYFRLQIFISGCSFLQSVDELLEFIETWGCVISFATWQPGNRSEYIHLLFKALTLRAPGTLINHLLFVIGSLY